MEYKPKIIKGKVSGTGWPIDGHTLYFSQWDYDNFDSCHLFSWDDEDDRAVMLTFYQTESDAGLCLYDTLEEFEKAWNADEWESQGVFCLDLDKVEVLEVLQEERKEGTTQGKERPERENILDDVIAERKRQDEKWGEQNHSAYIWASIIGEEYGEMCKAINEFGFNPTPEREQDIYTEAIQTMASCMAMLEGMERSRKQEAET